MTYHCGIMYLFDHPRLNSRQSMWMALINEFDFEIKHIKGKENRVEDALIWSVHTIHLETKSVGDSNIKKRTRSLLQEDGFLNHARERLQQEPNEKKYEWYRILTNGLLLYNNRLYVPNSTELRHLSMDEFHRMPYVGHPGYQKVVTIVR